MDASDLLELADGNLAEANREFSRWYPPYQIQERDDALFVASGTRFPVGMSNCALPTGATGPDGDAFLTAACGYFAALQRGFTVYARGHRDTSLIEACERAGYARVGDSPGMALVDRIEAPPRLPTGVSLRAVRTPAEAAGYVEVVASAFEALSFPGDVTRRLLSRPERWLRPYVHVVALYDHDQPVSGAMLLFSHGIAGVYWVGTIAAARGRGYAAAVMRAIGFRAFAQGASAVVLQASPFGEPVYRRLGYREITRYPWYLVRAEQATAR
jgi:GNAT superfamily N-acetyltransferase